MNIDFKFANASQKATYFATARNQCFSGGFNNGKSYVECFKTFTLLATFSNYRTFIARQVRADLMKTTYQTFMKICPKEFIETNNQQDGITVFKNGSVNYWLHLDHVDESTLRGLEVNSGFVDQAEEVEEKVYDVLDARIGRWDKAIVPQNLIDQFPNWPTNKLTGLHVAPSYLMLACNPDTQFHWIYRKYHPQSLERNPKYFFVEGEWDSTLGSVEAYEAALAHDPEWVEKYVKGAWGVSNAQIHRLLPSSQLEYSADLLKDIFTKGNLYRSMDHGESSPTCCLWWAVYKGVFVCFREYYVANKVISDHRAAINDLSGTESYSASYADPSIFDTESKKRAGFWSIADEYLTKDIKNKSIAWIPADNNEFATRNRINEYLRPSESYTHPVSGVSPAPRIYFIKKSEEYPFGCFHSINQLQSQRRVLIGYVDGKAVYDDAREETVTDHAYDPIRYFIAMHGTGNTEPVRKIPRNSIKFYKMMMKRKAIMVPASVHA